MQSSYSDLISEHEEINGLAAAILRDLDDGAVDTALLSARLAELARCVEDHIGREEAIVASMERVAMTLPWTQAWIDGAAAFERLRRDWVAYLGAWGPAEIAADRAGFTAASRDILGRLLTRIEQETRAFYAVALQHGAIALR